MSASRDVAKQSSSGPGRVISDWRPEDPDYWERTGKKVATVAGAAAGGYAGNQVQGNMQANDTYTTTETRCSTVTDTSENVVGYDVKYQIGDKVSQVRMDRDPGTQIPLSKEGELLLVQKAAE